ncbi:TlpA family protein disulfide reductase [bacterium]|nr:TlpA family protein disulfide reductase [bacterium]
MNICRPIISTFSALICLLSSFIVFSAELKSYDIENGIDFSLTDLNEKVRTLSDYKGKVLLVNFWASWCLPCLLEMPSIKRLSVTLNDENFEIVTINISDSPGRIRETLKRLQLNLPVLLDTDSKTFKAWHGHILPTSFLLDRTGRIRYRVIGPMDWENADALSTIKQLVQSQ